MGRDGSLRGEVSPESARTTGEKNHDSVPFNRGSQKKMGSPEPTGRRFAVFRRRADTPPAASATGASSMANRAQPGGRGRDDIQHNGDPTSPASGIGDFECQNIGNCYVIRIYPPEAMDFERFPVEDWPSQAGNSSRSYGAASANGGRENFGCQTNSGSLLIEMGWLASQRRVAGSGPGQGRKKSR